MKIYFINWKADYEVKMINYLKGHYPVVNICVPGKYLWLNKKIKKIGLESKWLGRLFIKWHLKGLQSHDAVIFNDSLLNKGINQYIIDSVNCHKVLLLRNSVDEKFINKCCSYFDLIYDFEHKKVSNKKVKHLEQFFPIGFDEVGNYESKKATNEKSVCFFLGRDKGRLDVITMLAEKLIEYNLVIDFNIVKDNRETSISKYFIDNPLTYEENLTRLLSSDVIVDITQDNQSGWTLRVLEALYFNKKIITNNINVLESSIYSPQRFFILKHDNWERLNDFICSSLEPVSKDLLYSFSPDFMLGKISRDIINL